MFSTMASNWDFLGFQNPRRVPPTLFTVNRALKRFSRVSRDHLESRTGPRAPEVPTWPLWQLYSWAGKDENLEATNWAKGGSKGRNKEEIRMKSEPHLKSTSVLGPPQWRAPPSSPRKSPPRTRSIRPHRAYPVCDPESIQHVSFQPVSSF